jgi:hypothetical protein
MAFATFPSAPLSSSAARPARVASALVFLSLAIFLPLVVLAMRLYPGGTSWDPTTTGHDFWLNYLCDLLRERSLSGTPNPVGSALAKVAMLVLAGGLVPFFWLLPRLFSRHRRLGIAVRALGTSAALAVPGVVFLPGDRFGILHGISVVVAAIPGLAAATCAVIGLVAGEARPRHAAVIGLATLVVATIDFALYVPQILIDGPGPTAVAVLERISLVLVLGWMALVAIRSSRA